MSDRTEWDEKVRLEAIRALEILDTPPEASFDRITRIAATMCEAPIALISLVDEHRQWFKSRIGVPFTETPRKYAFCDYAIRLREPLAIPDTMLDERFRENPNTKAGVRSYFGAQLVTSGGVTIGTLCVMDTVPRELKPDQIALLRDLADLVVHELEVRKAVAFAKAAADRFARFVRESAVAMAMLDRDMRYLAVSPRWIADYGIDVDDVIGRSHYEVFPEIPERWLKVHRDCLAGVPASSDGDTFVRADGRVHVLRWRIEPWYDYCDVVGGVLMLSEDLTSLVAAQGASEEANQILEAALDLAGAVAWDYDVARETLTARSANGSLTGYLCPAKLPIDRLWSRVHFSDYPDVMELWRRHLDGGDPLDAEHRVYLPDGGECWVRTYARAVDDDDGHPMKILGLTKDVTRQRSDQEALRVARRVAEAANTAKTELLGVLSHEIRNPLNGILGLARLLDISFSGDARGKKMLGTLIETASMLERLLDSVIDMSRLDLGEMKLSSEAFNIVESVNSVVGLYAGMASAKGVKLALRVDGRMAVTRKGDELRLKQVVSNLLNNAIKFTDEGSIDVVLTDVDGSILLKVQDTGVGIPADKVAAIFKPFSRVETKGRSNPDGVGLGLSICQRIVALMGGTISVNSAPGRGTTFIVRIPLQCAGEDLVGVRADTDPFPDFAGRRPRILVVDDNPTNQRVLGMFLEPLGCEIAYAAEGREAVAKWKSFAPDCIIMDIFMPVCSGPDACAEIRQSEAACGLPRVAILATTADPAYEARDRYMAMGFDDFVSKPIDPSNLQTIVRDAIFGATAIDQPDRAVAFGA